MNEKHINSTCMNSNVSSSSTSIISQCMDVCVPLNLQPYAKIGTIQTQCCGEPSINLEKRYCKNNQCGFILSITQTICFEVPVKYGVAIEEGQEEIVYNNVSNYNNENYR